MISDPAVIVVTKNVPSNPLKEETGTYGPTVGREICERVPPLIAPSALLYMIAPTAPAAPARAVLRPNSQVPRFIKAILPVTAEGKSV